MGVYNRWTSKRSNIDGHGEMEKGRFKTTIKELSQFDNKMPEELESELTILMWTIQYQRERLIGLTSIL